MSGWRRSWGLLALGLLVYSAGFVVWWPDAVLVSDEAAYVAQAMAFAEGRITSERLDPNDGSIIRTLPSTYPPGTSALQAPFVLLGGRAAAPLASLLGVFALVLGTGAWLRAAGREPRFALAALLFLPTLALGRVGMSDVPSAAAVAVGLALFWRGRSGSRAAAWGSGLVAGLSLLFREPNALAFAPLFAGSLLRRDRNAWWIVAGGVVGVAVRAASTWAVFGDPLYYRPNSSLGVSPLANAAINLPLYLLVLLVLVPGGLLFTVLHRGERRFEIVSTVVIFVLFYGVYGYSGVESGFAKRLVLGGRFMLPLLPLVVFAAAESVPRLLAPVLRAIDRRPPLRTALLGTMLVGGGLALLGVHAVLGRWGGAQASMERAIVAAVADEAYFVGNAGGLGKFLGGLPGRRTFVNREELPPRDVVRLRGLHPTFLVFLDRNDSPARVADAEANAEFVRDVQSWCSLRELVDERPTSFERLRILEVTDCRGAKGKRVADPVEPGVPTPPAARLDE